jgi:hypothetical protein
MAVVMVEALVESAILGRHGGGCVPDLFIVSV